MMNTECSLYQLSPVLLMEIPSIPVGSKSIVSSVEMGLFKRLLIWEIKM